MNAALGLTHHPSIPPSFPPPSPLTPQNALRKVPLSRAPWNHVGYFVLGCWAGNKYVEVERRLLLDVNEIRADKGMPPLVGSGYWIKYLPPAQE